MPLTVINGYADTLIHNDNLLGYNEFLATGSTDTVIQLLNYIPLRTLLHLPVLYCK